MPVVYILYIVNDPLRRVYVGSTTNPETRIPLHISTLRAGTHANAELQCAYNEYGGVIHTAIVEHCKNNGSLREAESMWMRKYPTSRLFNRMNSSPFGVDFSQKGVGERKVISRAVQLKAMREAVRTGTTLCALIDTAVEKHIAVSSNLG